VAAGVASALATAASRLELFLVNPSGDVDGVLLRDGRAFFFPSDIGRTIAGGVQLNDPLRVAVHDGHRVLVDERDQSEYDLTPVARGGGPVGVPALQRAYARGHLAAFMREPGGGIQGFVLSSGEQVRVPAALGARLATLRTGDIVVVRGFGNQGRWGLGIQAMQVEDDQGHVLISR
jgi:hypothetical protein